MPAKAWVRAVFGVGIGVAPVVALVMLAAGPVPVVVRIGALALAAGWLALAALVCWHVLPDLDLPGRTFRRGPAGRREIALTFDDGPNGEHTRQILDTLARHGAKATFFCVGGAVRQHPGLVARMVAEGHEVGNHTHTHALLPTLPEDELAAEIDEAQRAIADAGVPEPRLFRAPKGFKHRSLHRLLRERGLTLVGWTRGVWDTDRPGVATIARRARPAIEDGAILLLHDGHAGLDRSQTAEALELILHECERRGLVPVTLGRMMRARSRPDANA